MSAHSDSTDATATRVFATMQRLVTALDLRPAKIELLVALTYGTMTLREIALQSEPPAGRP